MVISKLGTDKGSDSAIIKKKYSTNNKHMRTKNLILLTVNLTPDVSDGPLLIIFFDSHASAICMSEFPSPSSRGIVYFQ